MESTRFDRPIIITGMGGAGTTMVDVFLRRCDGVGPRNMEEVALQELLDKMVGRVWHSKYAALLERHNVWLRIQPNDDAIHVWKKDLPHRKMYKDITYDSVDELGESHRIELEDELLAGEEKRYGRYLWKSGIIHHYIGVIYKLWPDAKVIFMLRDCPALLCSRVLDHPSPNIKEMATKYFNELWLSGVLSANRIKQKKLPVLFVEYNRFIKNMPAELERILRFSEIELNEDVSNIKLTDRSLAWKERVPEEFHKMFVDFGKPYIELYNDLVSYEL